MNTLHFSRVQGVLTNGAAGAARDCSMVLSSDVLALHFHFEPYGTWEESRIPTSARQERGKGKDSGKRNAHTSVR